jgi:SAM-dependent methyltransferase
VFIRELTHAAAKLIPDDSQDLIYVDADHTYPSVREDIADWLPKLRSGGIMAGHDYHPGQPRRNGVAQAVHEAFGVENVLRLPFMCWATVKGTPLRTMYSPAFFARRPGKFRDRQHAVADMLARMFQPAEVYDLGCGIGSYLERFAALGLPVAGSDRWADNAREHMAESVRYRVESLDAGQLMRPAERYGLVLCLEVAEHLPESAAPILAGNLRSLCSPAASQWNREGCGKVVFSAAGPGVRGRGHINCKPQEWWRDVFRWAGLPYDSGVTGRLRRELAAIGDPLDYAARVMVFDGPAQ